MAEITESPSTNAGPIHLDDPESVRASVREYYGTVLTRTADLKTSACCDATNVRPAVRQALRNVPDEVVERYYGCGSALPEGIESIAANLISSSPSATTVETEATTKTPCSKSSCCAPPAPSTCTNRNQNRGLKVLDLGSGSGRDCYVLAALVGEQGEVVGVDMTPEQIAIADKHRESYCRSTLGYSRVNLNFVHGLIENLPSLFPGLGCTPGGPAAPPAVENCPVGPSASDVAKSLNGDGFDLVVSNCVVNLSPDKAAVLSGVYQVLRVGGEFHLADVFSDRRLSESVRQNPVLVGECLGGALYISDFLHLCRKIGFIDPRILRKKEIIVHDPTLRHLLGNARFYSITWRCFKLPVELAEPNCEDYGQIAFYNGGMCSAPHRYALDAGHTFETGKPVLVCGNSAAMLENAWLKPFFTVLGNRNVHYGLFPCGPSSNSGSTSDPSDGGASSCASKSSCC